jgi:hypothetical protein
MKIMQRAMEMARASGDTAEQAALRMQYNKAGQGALLQLTKQQQMVGNFEKTAVKNADLALQLSNKVNRTGVPVINRWVNAGRKKLMGDVEVAQFHAANETFVNEYAKIMSGSMGNTPVSDQMRQHAHELLETAMTQEQYAGVITTLKQEMKNRMDSFPEQIAELSAQLSGTGAMPGAAATQSPPKNNLPSKNAKGWTLMEDPQGNKAYVGPNGEIEEVQ